MTDEQINAAIAKACGWKKPARKTVLNEKGYFVTQHAQSAPNYCNDLNAMHEAEKTLIGLNRHAFCDMLLDTVADSPDHLWEVLTATARQRAEAFLRTLGKWEEDK